MTQAANLGALGTNAGTTGILPIAGGGTAGTGGAIGFKNRIINGAMVLDQRNNGAAITTSDAYCLDRWNTQNNTSAGTVTTQQVVDAPAGFYYSGKKTFTSVTLNATNGYANYQQAIEVNNLLDLAYGAASAKTITVSFWVKSSVTGAHSFCLQNYTSTRRSYLSSYTVSAANTWEQKVITIAGDTSFALSSTLNGTGLQVRFSQFGGTQYSSATANAWQSADVFFLTGCVTPAATNGATWQVTGVQLEVGTTATNFDVRSYGTELQLCQRYCQIVPRGIFGRAESGTVANLSGPRPVPMRGSTTLTKTANGLFNVNGIGQVDITSINSSGSSPTGIYIQVIVNGNVSGNYGYNNADGWAFESAEL
jgi:hypothetical protein